MNAVTFSILPFALLGLLVIAVVAFDLYKARTADEIRRSRRGSPSEYDGHENYLEEADSREAHGSHWVKFFGDPLFACLGGVTVGRWLDDPGVGLPSDGPFVLGVILVAAAGVGCAQVLGSAKTRLYGYTGVFVLFIVGFVLPMEHEYNGRALRAELLARRVSIDNRAREKWRSDIWASGAHGSAEPPMLAVTDDGTTATITNAGDRTLPCVKLAREGRARPGGAAYCPLQDAFTGRRCALLDAGETRSYVMSDSAAAACEGGRLEYEIGEYTDPEPSWWSDSALARFDTRSAVLVR